MDLKERCFGYFRAFSAQDLDLLDGLYADDVCLRDWETDVKGKKAVLNANRRLFSAVKSLDIKPSAMCRDGDTVACEIDIVVNGTEVLSVVDILQFDGTGRIRAIRAYKC
jgi:ketosteroid isomerase-like protein